MGALAFTGGPAQSPGICARLEASFERPVIAALKEYRNVGKRVSDASEGLC